MPKKTKDSQPICIRMDKALLERLNQFCEIAGQTKTTAIERAVNFYIENYEAIMRRANIGQSTH